MPPSILTKPRSVELFQLGEFGNTLRQWNTPDEAWLSGYRGKVAVRYKSPLGGGGPCKYNIPIHCANYVIAEFCYERKWDSKYFYVNEMGPDDKITMQGEYIQWNAWGHYLLYSSIKKPMRDALKEKSQHHCGPGALLILRDKMTQHSYEDFELLSNQYPDHTIEFSCYSVNLGSLPRRNTIFWEVRKY